MRAGHRRGALDERRDEEGRDASSWRRWSIGSGTRTRGATTRARRRARRCAREHRSARSRSSDARDLREDRPPVDRGEWSMTPPTVNAYYSPDRNNINFPAGILQPPFYLAGRDAALNYGGAGAVIGHELTHGFDDQGRQYDAQGNLRDWWTEADGKAFEARASCIADQYSELRRGRRHEDQRAAHARREHRRQRRSAPRADGLPGRPRRDATRPSSTGFTPEQRVFLGWAQVWCENAGPEAERLKAATNPHSSNMYRVNGVVSNMPEFQKAFSCKPDAPDGPPERVPRMVSSSLDIVHETIVSCERCPRLRDYCARVAREKRRAFRDDVVLGQAGARLRRSARPRSCSSASRRPRTAPTAPAACSRATASAARATF